MPGSILASSINIDSDDRQLFFDFTNGLVLILKTVFDLAAYFSDLEIG